MLYRGTGEESFSQEANKENPQQLQDEVENISKLIEENLQTMEPKVSLHYLKPWDTFMYLFKVKKMIIIIYCFCNTQNVLKLTLYTVELHESSSNS